MVKQEGSIQELRTLLYKMSSPKMDGSHKVNPNDIKRLLIKIANEYDELGKQNENLTQFILVLIKQKKAGINLPSEVIIFNLEQIKQKPIEEILKEYK